MAPLAPAKSVFSVIDALDHPHGGRILRLRLRKGEAPAVKELRGGTLIARDEEGDEEKRLSVAGFALFGGRVTDARLARSGRVDVHVRDAAADAVGVGWTLSGPG